MKTLRSLSGKREFLLVKRRSSERRFCFPCPMCSIRIMNVSTHNSLVLGITVRRVIGNAVVRNRIKRRIREIFRSHVLRKSEGKHVVVTVLNSAMAWWPFEKLKKLLLQDF